MGRQSSCGREALLYPGVCSALDLHGAALSQTALRHNLPIPLDSRLLLKEQGAGVARRAFAQFCVVHQLWSFLDREALLSCHTHLLKELRQCPIHAATFEEYLEAVTDAECGGTFNSGHP